MELRKKTKNIIIIILMIIIIGLLMKLRTFNNHSQFSSEFTDLDVSSKQDIIHDIKPKTEENEYTNFVGYGLLKLSKDYPNIYLVNEGNNTVYMQFDVYQDQNLIYSSALVEPGKMESVDVYHMLEAGEHDLIYLISTYDIKTKELCMTGVKQQQTVNVVK